MGRESRVYFLKAVDIFYLFNFIYLREKERKCELGEKGRERGRERKKET